MQLVARAGFNGKTFVSGKATPLSQSRSSRQRALRLICTANSSKPGKTRQSISHFEKLNALLGISLAAAPSQAADPTYNNAAGSEFIRNVFGAVYILLLTFFVGKLFLRRANKGRSQRWGKAPQSKASALLEDAADKFAAPTSPLSALGGAVQAGFLCWLLYLFTTNLDGFFEAQKVPSQYTARNITLTVQTIVRAISYLFTFICAVNTIGLTGLTIQLLIFPEKPEDWTKER